MSRADGERRASGATAFFALVLVVVAACAHSQVAESAYPGAEGLIAFNRQFGAEVDIAVVRPDRTGLHVLIRNARNPAWSPDGRRLAFTRRSRGGDIDIWIADADGSGQHELLSPDLNEAHPSWSPDGQRLVFEGSVHGQQTDELFVENADGSQRVQLTHESPSSLEDSPGSPKWCPTRNLIAFERAGGLLLIQPDGGGETDLPATRDGTATDPDWSPDGSQLVYDAAGRSGRAGAWDDLFLIPVDGQTARHLTNTIDDEGDAAWSPDGARLAYTLWTTRGGAATDHGDLYVVNPLDGRRQPLIRGAASKWGAAWQPTPVALHAMPSAGAG